ncbi:MAG: hypothetical protein K0S76_879 [Herbinix sp.]|nr:hypothetical protein [Herbinix sp.]
MSIESSVIFMPNNTKEASHHNLKSYFATPLLLGLGYKDLNLKMLESESSALPFGDTPMCYNNWSDFLTTCFPGAVLSPRMIL